MCVRESKKWVFSSNDPHDLQKFHSPPNNLMIGIVQVELHVLKPKHPKDHVNPRPFEC